MFKVVLSFKNAFRPPIDNIRLYNALFFSLNLVDKSKAKEFRDLVDTDRIKISSAFPLVNDEMYLPFPLNIKYKILSSLSEEDKKFGKKIKSKQTIAWSLLNKNIDDIKSCIIKELKVNRKKSQDFKERMLYLKNFVNRSTYEASLYSTYYIFMPQMYFLVEADDNYFKSHIIEGLHLLKNFGLGGDITTGRGIFDYSYENFDFSLDEENPKYLLISKMIPKDHRNLATSFYQLCEFKTITRTGYHIKNILCFNEGSVFDNKNETGVLKEFGNGIDYFVNGKAFYIPILGDQYET